jgi:hypothetical protein
VKVKTGERTRTEPVYSMTCDRCHELIRPLVRGPYRVDEFKLERWVGDVYPEGSFAWTHSVNCCSDCWPHLVAGVEAAGFTFWHEDSDGIGEPESDWRDA